MRGLIPLPERGALGRGGGRWTNYPNGTVEDAYAAWKLLHGAYGNDELKEMFDNRLPICKTTILRISIFCLSQHMWSVWH